MIGGNLLDPLVKDTKKVIYKKIYIFSFFPLQVTMFLCNGEEEARDLYERRRRASNSSETILIALAWDLVGFEDLLKEAARLTATCNRLIDYGTCENFNFGNIENDLNNLWNDLAGYLKQLFSKKRLPAIHLMVIMIAGEARNFKPYALPFHPNYCWSQ